MLKRALAIALGWVSLTGTQAPARPAVELWRLDCGDIDTDLGAFSDTFRYGGQRRTLADSCYLIRNGDRYLLWDTGLPGELAGRGEVEDDGNRMTVRTRVRDQLARIGVQPGQVSFVGISHYHDDHTGQAADFPGATLLIGGPDWEVVRGRPSAAARFRPWIGGGSRVEAVRADHDVFGDGSVIMLNMPGHTPGHHSLLVRLPRTGAVLLTGDLYHFTENYRTGGIPSFNTDRADTLASMARFQAVMRNLRARVIIQHEPADVARLPAFPASAR